MGKVNVVRINNEREVWKVPKYEAFASYSWTASKANLAVYEVSMRRWGCDERLLPGRAGMLIKRDSGEKTLYISPSFPEDMVEKVIEVIEAERKALVPLDSRVVLR